MDFISGYFLLFLAIGLVIFYNIPKKWQQYWLLLLSMFFYCFASLKLFAVMLGSAVISYASALLIEDGCAQRHALSGRRVSAKHSVKSGDSGKTALRYPGIILGLAVILLIGILLVLKTAATAPFLAARLHLGPFALLLPIGISFYTLQMIAYLTDVYHGKIRAQKNPVKYLLFILYFPQILQGPIPRYDDLMPQLTGQHKFHYETFVGGFELMLWGYFQKLVIADRANIMVNRLFGEYASFPGTYMLLAGVLYSIQLYTDFNGCVCIARGISEMFGISLADNFAHPYFATSIQDFWRRWHISLSSWLRDYVYIPLGGNRKGKCRQYVNLLLTFVVSGIWHGIGATYLVWGLLHGLYQIAGKVTKPLRMRVCECFHVDQNTFSHRLFRQFVTFMLVMLAWIFFRASSVLQAVSMIRSMVTTFNPWVLWDGSLYLLGLNAKNVWVLLWAILLLVLVSFLQTKCSIREKLMQQGIVFRYLVVLTGILVIFVFGIYGPGYDAAQFTYGGF